MVHNNTVRKLPRSYSASTVTKWTTWQTYPPCHMELRMCNHGSKLIQMGTPTPFYHCQHLTPPARIAAFVSHVGTESYALLQSK